MRALKLCLLSAVIGLASAALCALAEDSVSITPDVVYGHKDGLALTYDVIQPRDGNGAGVMWIQSGCWYSTWNDPKNMQQGCQPLLSKGITVFIVRHGSAPRYTVPECIEDVRRSVRAIRMKAGEFGVDPERLGAMGGSAGGHLTLMLTTTGDDGDPQAQDPVLRQSSRLAAAVAYYPPTDLRGWVNDPPEAIRRIPGLKPPLSFDASKEPACSPLLHVTDRTAPTLLIHGDKDELVPIEHSRNMIATLNEHKVPSELLVIAGAGHSFSAKDNEIAVPAMAAWFEKQLGTKDVPAREFIGK